MPITKTHFCHYVTGELKKPCQAHDSKPGSFQSYV